MRYISESEKDTYELGRSMGVTAPAGQIICLDGDLGAGKTVFTKGFAAGLGITEVVSSPTFTIIHEHSGGRLPLYHFDVYRIEDPDEMYEVGFEELFYGGGVCLIEWACLIADLIPADAVHITILRDAEDENKRVIDIE